MIYLIFILLLVFPAFGQVDRTGNSATYPVSVAVFIVGNALDVHSSWKELEGNPIVPTNAQGRLSWKGMALKAGVVVGNLVVQRLALRGGHHRRFVRRVASMANFVAGGFLVGIAIRNYSLRERSGVEQ